MRRCAFVAFFSLLSTGAAAASKGKILIVVSSENVLSLKDQKTFSTGYYLYPFDDHRRLSA